MGVAQKEDEEQGVDQQDIFDRMVLFLAALTPIGKPPPLAVRLAEALPFRRAQGSEEGRTLNVRAPAYG